MIKSWEIGKRFFCTPGIIFFVPPRPLQLLPMPTMWILLTLTSYDIVSSSRTKAMLINIGADKGSLFCVLLILEEHVCVYTGLLLSSLLLSEPCESVVAVSCEGGGSRRRRDPYGLPRWASNYFDPVCGTWWERDIGSYSPVELHKKSVSRRDPRRHGLVELGVTWRELSVGEVLGFERQWNPGWPDLLFIHILGASLTVAN